MRRRFLAGVFAVLTLSLSKGQAPAVSVDWPAFLARQDLVWTQAPTKWEDAPFIGNGNLGAVIHAMGGGALGWEINRTDVTHDGSRYPMGYLAVQIGGGSDSSGETRLDLWNAEARGALKTSRGGLVRWRSFAAASPSVIVLELAGLKAEPSAQVVWLPTLARPPRLARRTAGYPPEALHPPPEITTLVDGVNSTQTFLGGGAFAVVLRRIYSSMDRKVYVIAVDRGDTASRALSEAMLSAERAASLGLDGLQSTHRAWWHQYYPASFVSLPNPRLESFYWIQLYKLASAMRPDGPILDQMGPWYRSNPPTPWPRITWNLGVELAYSPIFAANHLPLGESLFSALDRRRAALIANVPPPLRAGAAAIGRSSDQSLVSPVNLATAQSDMQREMGNLPWVCELYWQYYRYGMDETVLTNRVLPLLGRAVGNYLAVLAKGPDGKYHLPVTYSPESASVADANYDLGLLRWGLETLIHTADRLKSADPRLPRWKETLAALAPFPVGPSGLLIGKGQPLAESHGHYSHLLAIYPLHLLRPDRPAERKLIETSLHTWEAHTKEFRGYSYAGAASLHALLGQGDAVLENLNALLDHHLKPNTFYADAGAVVGAPLAGATAIQDMLLQSWGNRIRVFPAMPAVWNDAAFANLRGEGGFLVSAVWHDSAVAWVKVEATAVGPCRLVVPGWTQAKVRAARRPAQAVAAGSIPGEFIFALGGKGGWVVLASSADAPLPKLTAVARPAGSPAVNSYPAHPSL